MQPVIKVLLELSIATDHLNTIHAIDIHFNYKNSENTITKMSRLKLFE